MNHIEMSCCAIELKETFCSMYELQILHVLKPYMKHYLEQRISYYSPDDVCDGVDVAHRYGCGWPDISQQHCEGRGCCYDTKEYTNRDAKHCFYPKGKDFFSLCNIIQQLHIENYYFFRCTLFLVWYLVIMYVKQVWYIFHYFNRSFICW